MKNIRVINSSRKTTEYINRKPKVYKGKVKITTVTYKGKPCVVKKTTSGRPYIIPYPLYPKNY